MIAFATPLQDIGKQIRQFTLGFSGCHILCNLTNYGTHDAVYLVFIRRKERLCIMVWMGIVLIIDKNTTVTDGCKLIMWLARSQCK